MNHTSNSGRMFAQNGHSTADAAARRCQMLNMRSIRTKYYWAREKALSSMSLGAERKLSEEIDMKGTYSDEILRPLYYYMMLLGLNHTFTGKKWKTPMMLYNYTALLLLICCTIRRITQIGEKSSNSHSSDADAGFKGSVLDPTFVLTLCHALLLFSGTSATFLLLKLQKQRSKMYHILDQGLGKNRSKELDEKHFFMNRVMVIMSFCFSFAMAAVQILTKLGIIGLPDTPNLIDDKFYFVILEGYVIFLAQSSISMLAILFYQLCKILQISIVKLVEEMVPPEKEDCPLPEQSLQQIHDVQLHYQEIFTGKLLIEDNFSFALFYTYGCCIPLTCLLGYISFRNRGADFMENMAVGLWITNTLITLGLFSFPAFMVHEEGEKLLTASFKMYHETLCEERDLLILGKVRIYEEIDTEIFTFVNVQTSADLHKPGEMCYGANETTGCGGIGSCLYCTSCNSIDEWKGLLGAELLVNDRPLGCDVVEPGHYDNVRLKFCIPRLARFLEMQGIEDDAIDHLIASTKNV
ncbi:hypothetical protein WR25_12978 [Diploscapter pachys]|uniref:Gustatory receptor n=1 Tax=Diploscapter pachys TaxID=2018661 RepID=A0A2A2LKD8_9BILA|nr:hypothetical protein WR25_12978 [Diploscapter pachys]